MCKLQELKYNSKYTNYVLVQTVTNAGPPYTRMAKNEILDSKRSRDGVKRKNGRVMRRE
jgi:hypothetical protein